MRRARAVAAGLTAVLLLAGCDPVQHWRHELVSETPAGVGGNGPSSNGLGKSSPDVVVFESAADDLVPNDDNGVTDVFVRDVARGTTRLVSVAAGGGSANGASSQPVLSSDGNRVAFVSLATDLVGQPVSGLGDVYVHSCLTGTTELVTVAATGTGGGNGRSEGPTFDQGQHVTWRSRRRPPTWGRQTPTESRMSMSATWSTTPRSWGPSTPLAPRQATAPAATPRGVPPRSA